MYMIGEIDGVQIFAGVGSATDANVMLAKLRIIQANATAMAWLREHVALSDSYAGVPTGAFENITREALRRADKVQ